MTSHQAVPYRSNPRLPAVSGPSSASYADAYRLARNLAASFGASTIIDIGFAAPRELMAASKCRWIIVDRDLHPTARRLYFPHQTWIDWDWPPDRDIPIADENLKGAIVVCAGVIDDIPDPAGLLTFLRRSSRHAAAIIVCTPERELQRPNSASGSRRGSSVTELSRNAKRPANRSGKWNLAEFKTLLAQNDLQPTFIGLTTDNDDSVQKNSIMAIIDRCPLAQARRPPDDFRPLVLTSTFNDGDIAREIVQKLLDDGIEVIVHDNWSDDGTFEQLTALASARDDLSVVRFPESGPSTYFELTALLRLKEEVAASYPGRWIIHHDSDEIRCSPWPDLSLRQGLYLVELMDFTAVDFTVCNFRPTDERFTPERSLERHIHHFEFSTDRADFIQAKAWRQSAKPVGLVDTAGHDAYFPERRVFPYKFLLKHYPLRSPSQARRKIFTERRPRFAPEEREAGWHYQYDAFDKKDSYVWNAAELIDFESSATRLDFLVELISGIGIVRNKLADRASMPIGLDANDPSPSEQGHMPSLAQDTFENEIAAWRRGHGEPGAAQQQTAILIAIAAASDRFREDAQLLENDNREYVKRLNAELHTTRDQIAAIKNAIEDRDLRLGVADDDLRRLMREVEDHERRLQAADGDLRRLTGEVEDRERRLEAADGDLRRLTGEVEDRERRLQTADGDLRRLMGEVEDRERRLQTADADLRRLMGEVEDRERRLQTADGDLRRLMGEIEDCDRQLRGLIAQIGDQHRQLVTADKEQRRLGRAIDDRDRWLAVASDELRRVLEKADLDQHQASSVVANSDRQLVLARQAEDSLRQDIRERDQRLMALERRLYEIETSTSWRVTAPVRKLLSRWRHARPRSKAQM
jgi:predicted  nucleic acid-binding Zn-ribbon protein